MKTVVFSGHHNSQCEAPYKGKVPQLKGLARWCSDKKVVDQQTRQHGAFSGSVILLPRLCRLSVLSGGGGVGTRPRYLIVCLWRRLLASRHCSF